MLGEPCSIAWRTCWLSYTVLNGSFLARANILQAEVFLFSPLMLSVSSWSNEPMVEVMLEKSEAVGVLGFEDQGCLIHRNKSARLK